MGWSRGEQGAGSRVVVFGVGQVSALQMLVRGGPASVVVVVDVSVVVRVVVSGGEADGQPGVNVKVKTIFGGCNQFYAKMS
jgi:hypothetical protein